MFRITSRRRRVLGIALFAAVASLLNAGPP